MDRSKKRYMLIAVSLGLLGIGLIYLNNRQREQILSEKVKVVTLSGNVAAGALLAAQTLAVAEMPAAFAPKGAVLAKDRMSVTNRRVLVNLQKGQCLLWNFLDVSLRDFGIAARLKPGERAITIGVDKTTGMESMLKAGSRVDILATFSSPENGKRVTRTLLQNVTILALGDGHDAGPYSSVTLRVDPSEAELLAFAERTAELRLVLRGVEDIEIIKETPTIDFNNLKEIEEKAQERKKQATGKPRIVYD
jgi:pilus assembly protein CpaB